MARKIRRKPLRVKVIEEWSPRGMTIHEWRTLRKFAEHFPGCELTGWEYRAKKEKGNSEENPMVAVAQTTADENLE